MKFAKIVFDSIMDSFIFFRKYKKKVAWLFLLELIFFILAFTSSLYFLNSVLQGFDYLRNFTVDQTLTESEEGLLELKDQLLFANKVVNDIYFDIGITLIILFVLFSLFGSISWLLSSSRNLKDFSLKHLLGFSGFTLLYFFIFILIYFILEYLVLDANLINNGVYSILISLFVVFYFSTLSYGLYVLKENKFLDLIKESFVLGIKKIHVFVLMWIIIFLAFVIGSLILRLSGPFSLYVGIILYLFIFVWFRIFLIMVVREFS